MATAFRTATFIVATATAVGIFAAIDTTHARETARLAALAATISTPVAIRDRLRDGLGGDAAWREFEETATPKQIASALLSHVVGEDLVRGRVEHARKRVVSSGVEAAGRDEPPLPYWLFVPKYEGSAMMGGTMSWTTPCFGNVTATVDAATNHLDGELLGITLSAAGKTSANCMSSFFFAAATATATAVAEIPTDGHRVFLNVTQLTAAERWLLDTYGVRMMTDATNKFESVASVIDTLLLFVPDFLGGFTDATIEADNMLYFNAIAQIEPPITYRKGPSGVIVGLNESDIMDGDALFVQDLDGMGRTIGLGQGGTPNHVAVFIRDDNGVLNVCEATSPNLKCTPYPEWLPENAKSGGDIVLAPLRPDLRANFNRSAAWAFINSTVGYSYGFFNFLLGWVDTPNDNYPCLPPDSERCLVWEHLELVALTIDAISPTLAGRFFNQALNHRVNATGLPIADVLMRGAQVFGYRGGDITAVPEKDEWTYRTTRYGKPAIGLSNVCSTYVCNVLRHGGAFAGTALAEGIQCTEQTPWNMQALQLWDTARMGANRPEACKLRDPDNQNCVLCGHTTFHLGPNSNAKPLTAWTGERCGGRAPWYVRNVTSC